MTAVVQASGARRVFPQEVNRTCGQPGFFKQLAATRVGRTFSRIDQARWQFPGEGLERGPVLPHERNFSALGESNDRDVIGLLDRVINLRFLAA